MMSNYDNVFSFFSDIFSLSDDDLLKYCRGLQQKLTDQQKIEADMEANDLFNEIIQLHLDQILQLH